MAVNDDPSFSIDVVGASTGKTFKGTFKAKKRLTMREKLARDGVRRNLLGAGNQEGAMGHAASIATIFGELSVRLTESPSWWQTAEQGLSLEDDNVVVEVYEAALKIEADAIAAIVKKGEEDAAALKKE